MTIRHSGATTSQVVSALNTAEPAAIVADSPYEKLHLADEHIHTEANVYPTLAAGVTVTCGTPAWTLGTIVEVVPASTITSMYDIHHLCIEALSANAVYEIVLYQGAGDTEIGRVRVVKNAIQDGTMNIPIITPIVPANARIRAEVASDSGNADTVTLSLMYHEYA
jgi:hypothetical protein